MQGPDVTPPQRPQPDIIPSTDSAQSPDSSMENLSPRDLAESWLKTRQSELIKGIEDTEQSLKFERTYRPTPMGIMPSWMEQGGSDASDWETERLSGIQDEEGRDDRIDELVAKLEGLENGLGRVVMSRTRVDAGDESTINRLANLEKQRRMETEERERIMREKSSGIDIEHGDVVVKSIDELLTLVDDGKIPFGHEGNEGWQLISKSRQPSWMTNYDGKDNFEYLFVFKNGEGAFERGANRIKILKGKDGYSVDLVDAGNGVVKTSKRENWWDNMAEVQATQTHFVLNPDGTRVKSQSVQNGTPHMDNHGHVTYMYYSTSEQRFTQDHFSEFNTKLASLYQDMKHLVPVEQAT